jgi:hypothetical protein
MIDRHASRDVGGLIGRAVDHDDQLVLGVERARVSPQHGLEPFFLVVRRNDDR